MDRVLEVYRDPVQDPDAAFGWSHRSVETLGPEESLSPLAVSEARISVGDLFP